MTRLLALLLLASSVSASVPTPREARHVAASPVADELRGAPETPIVPSAAAGRLGDAVPRAAGAPQPTSALGTVLLGGFATWYKTPGLTAAAGPLLRDVLGDWRGQVIEVESGSRSVTVQLTDFCACGSRHGVPTLLDLSDGAFAELGPLSAGVLRVSIEIGASPHPDDDRMRLEDMTLPATETVR